MILEEGTIYDYASETLDPVIQNVLLSKDNYFYHLPLMLRYKDQSNCPSYMKRENFEKLKADNGKLLDCVKIHTNTIINVLNKSVPDSSLTKTVVMDHLDWFSEDDARDEIVALAQKSAVGGIVFYRSAGKYPWYNWIFEEAGFQVESLQIREKKNLYIDRVNMYASFWKATKKE